MGNPKSPKEEPPKTPGPEGYVSELDRTRAEENISNFLTTKFEGEVKNVFQGASKALAQRHLDSVLNYRSVYLTETLLNRLKKGLPELMDRSALAVTNSLAHLVAASGLKDEDRKAIVQLGSQMQSLKTKLEELRIPTAHGDGALSTKDRLLGEQIHSELVNLERQLKAKSIDPAAWGPNRTSSEPGRSANRLQRSKNHHRRHRGFSRER